MPFSAHLEELRSRLIRSLLVIGAFFVVAWMVAMKPLTLLILRPHRLAVEALGEDAARLGLEPKLHVLGVGEAIFFKLKLAMLAALVFGLPYLLYQLWAFIAAGLYPKERRVVQRAVPLGLGLGVVGVLFGYFLAIPLVIEFLYKEMDPDTMTADIQLSTYLTVFLLLTVALAIVFQLPLILASLGRAGLVTAAGLRSRRRHFILAAFVFGAVFTPPDPYSQALMAIPTVLLYEIGILLVAWHERSRRAPGGTP